MLTQEEGWNVFDAPAEFGRMGVPNENWKASAANKEFKVSVSLSLSSLSLSLSLSLFSLSLSLLSSLFPLLEKQQLFFSCVQMKIRIQVYLC